MKKKEGKTTSSVVEIVRYVECQRNYVVVLGGYAIDGCCELLASGEQGMAAFTCHACGCHRSFHRREVHYEVVCDFSPPTSETSPSISET